MTKGDWVIHRLTGKYEKLDRRIETINAYDEQGIPLTNDLLIDIGFDKVGLFYQLEDNGNKMLLAWCTEGYWKCQFWTPKNKANPKIPCLYNIEYLHHLQQVYRLSGEELEIDLSTLDH